ncbi:hypothetical protein OG730_36345 [Streptomyces sp. NBC_01298]|uniref:hypothetical protein n=1 Tax=Streptomyces sp. NBC_01298 TaxID=2903817 RepID=UPI002E11E4F4|nr:hypothetical protein OG730_36345 [Streptomyces sp. NBC_01298]
MRVVSSVAGFLVVLGAFVSVTQALVTPRAMRSKLPRIVRVLAREEGIAYDPDPLPEDPIELTYEEFLDGVVRMRERGVTMARDPEQAWPHFRGWRVNYEAVAYALAYRIDAVPAPWSGPRRRGGGPLEVPTPVDRKPAA